MFVIVKCNSLVEANIVSTRKKGQQDRRLLNQLDDFDQNAIIGDAVSSSERNAVVNKGSVDREFIVQYSDGISITNENTVNVQTLLRCLNERIDRELGNITDTVEDRIQNAILTAVDKIIRSRIELAVRSINTSPGRDPASVTAFLKRVERKGITASFENVSEKHNTFHAINANDDTWGNIPDEVSELLVPRTHFYRQ